MQGDRFPAQRQPNARAHHFQHRGLLIHQCHHVLLAIVLREYLRQKPMVSRNLGSADPGQGGQLRPMGIGNTILPARRSDDAIGKNWPAFRRGSGRPDPAPGPPDRRAGQIKPASIWPRRRRNSVSPLTPWTSSVWMSGKSVRISFSRRPSRMNSGSTMVPIFNLPLIRPERCRALRRNSDRAFSTASAFSIKAAPSSVRVSPRGLRVKRVIPVSAASRFS